MREIKNILTATDFSRGAEVAAKAAKLAADLYKSKLIAAHVLQNMDETFSLLVEDVDDLEQQALKEAEENMGALLEDLRVSRSLSRSVVDKGSPIDGLIRVGLREHADLVVAGMLGSTGAQKQGTLGGVVEQLLMSGLFDLLLVSEKIGDKLEKVAVATDFSELADLALERATDISKRAGLDTITLVHAYEWPQGYSKLGLTPDETDVNCRSAVQNRYDEMLERVPPTQGITYRPVFVRGRAEEAVRDACEGDGIDLLVIGSAGRTAAVSALIGSVALKIARNAPCSLWITRPAGHKLTIIDALCKMMGIECQ